MHLLMFLQKVFKGCILNYPASLNSPGFKGGEMLRNQWPDCSGMGGRNQSEWVAGMGRNTQIKSFSSSVGGWRPMIILEIQFSDLPHVTANRACVRYRSRIRHLSIAFIVLPLSLIVLISLFLFFSEEILMLPNSVSTDICFHNYRFV